jgi:tetraacyldisaccharide 4'-kinase
MNPSLERFGLRVISGEARGIAPSLVRGVLSVGEPFYTAAMAARNWLYDASRLTAHRLPHPVISVGNLTAGGTGKTPVVRWLAEQLIARGKHPAILMRGYTVAGATSSDERELLHTYLNGDPQRSVAVVANPDRIGGANQAFREQPRTDVILLDDAFQHRRVARDFDLLLINAADPFGFEHVFPRGLLRESPRGLARADAILLTRSDAVSAQKLAQIEQRIRAIDPLVPMFRAVHELAGLRWPPTAAGAPPDEPIAWLRGRSFFSFSGIGSPRTFHAQLAAIGGQPAGSRAFPDHHEYTDADIASLVHDARACGAEVLLTTEKDWVKLSRLTSAREATPPILRVEARIRFVHPDDQTTLLAAIDRRIAPREA